MHEFIELDNAVIRTIRYGEGKPLFLIPGWPFSSTIYALLEPYLGKHYQVTSLDLPGWCGKSYFKESQGFAVKNYLEIIQECLEKLYPDGNAVNIGGISIGGTLALLTANKQNNIDKVFAQSSPYRGDFFLRTNGIKTKLMDAGRNLPQIGNSLKKFYKIQHMKTYWKNRQNLPKDMFKNIMDEYDSLEPKCVLEFACDFFHSNYSKNLEKVENEAHIIACKKDSFVPTYFMKELADILPNSIYVEVSEYSHYFLAENPQKFGEILLNNLGTRKEESVKFLKSTKSSL